MRRLPGRFTFPVVGITFRVNDYPRNVHLLADIMAHLDHVADDPAVLQFFHHRRFRPIMDEVLAHGRVPVVVERDYHNPVSRHAVRVRVPILEALFLGYVPENSHGGIALLLAPELDDEVPWHGWIRRVRVHPDHPENPGVDVTLVRGETGRPVTVLPVVERTSREWDLFESPPGYGED